jgi:hypothetical protein
MPSEPKRYKSGQWVVLGVVLGGFVGLLVGKFAIGLIFGFFVGIAVDATQAQGFGLGG